MYYFTHADVVDVLILRPVTVGGMVERVSQEIELKKAWRPRNNTVFIAIVHPPAASQLLEDVPARYRRRQCPSKRFLPKRKTSLNAICISHLLEQGFYLPDCNMIASAHG